MFSKYLKFMLLTTVLLQASPKLFNGYGNQIEAFQKDCQTYLKLSLDNKEIKKKCKLYNSKANQAFKYGRKLDPSVDSDNINLDKAEKYNSYLHELEENKDYILHLLREEIYKARKQENIKYYSQLITSNEIALGDSDYSFMKKHEDKFDKNSKYIMHELNLCEQMVILIKKEKETIHLEHEEKIASLEKEKEAIRLEYQRFKKANEVTSLKEAREKEKIRQAKEKVRIRQAKEKKSYKSSTTRSSYRPINSSPRMSEVDLFNRCMDSCNMATVGLTTERAFNACFAKCQ